MPWLCLCSQLGTIAAQITQRWVWYLNSKRRDIKDLTESNSQCCYGGNAVQFCLAEPPVGFILLGLEHKSKWNIWAYHRRAILLNQVNGTEAWETGVEGTAGRTLHPRERRLESKRTAQIKQKLHFSPFLFKFENYLLHVQESPRCQVQKSRKEENSLVIWGWCNVRILSHTFAQSFRETQKIENQTPARRRNFSLCTLVRRKSVFSSWNKEKYAWKFSRHSIEFLWLSFTISKIRTLQGLIK